tara:strand:- start:735 stop:1145 length:411 start_codon:yes stop_codon:yes gene_type:complete
MKILKKNIQLGIIKLKTIIFILMFFSVNGFSSEKNVYQGNFVEIKILDKLSSKNVSLNLKIGVEKKYQNLSLKALKCKNSEFDDDPEITAYLQVKDLKNSTNDSVFIFNGWTFASSPTLKTFDHPVYDIWLVKCYS